MADSPDTTNPSPQMSPGGRDILAVCFWHDGQVEATMVVNSPDAALTAALTILATRDALYSGDQLTVDGTVRPNLIERRLG